MEVPTALNLWQLLDQSGVEVMVSGNGTMGAMMFGQVRDEKIILNHERLYLPLGSNEKVPKLSDDMHELKKPLKSRALKERAIEGKYENYNHRHFLNLYELIESNEITKTDKTLLSSIKVNFVKDKSVSLSFRVERI